MSNYKFLNDKIFDEILEKYNEQEITKYKKELIYVYENESKYRCQCITKKMSVRQFQIDKEGKCVIIENENNEEKNTLPYMNYYEKIDEIFNKLYEKYNFDKFLFSKKKELLLFYDNENSYRFKKCENINWFVDENGEIKIIDKK